MANFQPLRVSMLDQLGLVETDLPEFLSSKQKSHPEEQVCISLSQCGQVGCQLVIVHSANYCLGLIPATSPPSQLSVFDRLSAQRFEEPKPRRKRKAKKPHFAAASINMTGRGRDSIRSRRERQGVCTPSTSSPDSNYSPGLSQVLVESEGVFRGIKSRVAILTIMDNSPLPQEQYLWSY